MFPLARNHSSTHFNVVIMLLFSFPLLGGVGVGSFEAYLIWILIFQSLRPLKAGEAFTFKFVLHWLLLKTATHVYELHRCARTEPNEALIWMWLLSGLIAVICSFIALLLIFLIADGRKLIAVFLAYRTQWYTHLNVVILSPFFFSRPGRAGVCSFEAYFRSELSIFSHSAPSRRGRAAYSNSSCSNPLCLTTLILLFW